MNKKLLALLLISAGVNAGEWESTAASTASLRTYGAILVSSDAIDTEKNNIALITYWRAQRGKEDQDFYRCVDVVSKSFEPISQECWTVKTPSGRREIVE